MRTRTFLIMVFVLLTGVIQSVIAQEPQTFLYATSESYYSDVDIYLYDMDTATSTLIAEIAGVSPNVGFSYDGEYVYLLSNGDNENRIAELHHLDTSERILISDQLWTDVCEISLYGSPDNRFLVYITQPDDETIQHHVYDLQTGEVFTLPEKLPLWETFDPQWSPDGRYLIQYIPGLPYEPKANIWEIDTHEIIATLNVNQLYSTPWSPDGRYFAFISDERNSEMSIFDTETITVHTYEGSDVGKWSPNNQYLSYQNGTTRMLLDIIADTSHSIYESVYASYKYGWSYDSQYSAVAKNNADEKGILLFEPSTGDEITLDNMANYIQSLSWSPDAHMIAVLQENGGDDPNLSDLLVYNVDDDSLITEHEVTIPIIYGDIPLRWSSSSTHLTVWLEDGIHLLNLDDGELSHLNPSVTLTSSPRWSPNGQFLAYDTSRDAYVFDVKTGKTLTLDEDNIIRFIGWQGANHNNTLVKCGDGGG